MKRVSIPHGPMTQRQLGAIVGVLLAVLFVVLFVTNQNKGLFTDKVTLFSDFRTITGLRRGSPVQLAGVEVGAVSSIDFANVRYECDPLTEDVGRFGAGRTDDCDDFLFCTPVGLCGDLEPWAGRGEHTLCSSSEECREDEICVTGEFRRRERRVPWSGINGVCARYNTEHWRVRVRMVVNESLLEIIRTDSRAMVAANSVLGSQLVNISPGHGDPLSGDFRIQSSPSLFEDIDRFRKRIESFLENADISITAINSVIDELRDERTIDAIRGIAVNLETVTEHVAEQRGLVGALVGSPEYRRDFGRTLHAVRNTTEGLEETSRHANHILATVDNNFEPIVEETRRAVVALGALLHDLRDPDNRSLVATLLIDEDGDLAEHSAGLIHNTAEITRNGRSIAESIDNGDGTLGKLVNDPTLREDVGKLLSSLAKNDLIRAIAIWALDKKDVADVKAGKDPAGPPR